MSLLYERLVKKQSEDGGKTWTIVEPIDTKVGKLIDDNADCEDGKVPFVYDWILVDYEYICEETTSSSE